MLHLVCAELKATHGYTTFHAALERRGAKHLFGHVWVIECGETAHELHQELEQFLAEQDSLLIAEIKDGIVTNTTTPL